MHTYPCGVVVLHATHNNSIALYCMLLCRLLHLSNDWTLSFSSLTSIWDFPIVRCCVYCCIYPMTGLCPYRHRLAYGIPQYACSNILPWQLSLVAYVQHLRCPGTIIIILSTRVEHHRRVIGVSSARCFVPLSFESSRFPASARCLFFLLSTDLWSFVFVFCSCLLN